MMEKKLNRITVILEGGLGNQLFGWATGFELSNKLDFDLCLNISRLQQHGFTLSELNHNATIVSERMQRFPRLRRRDKIFLEKSFNFDQKFLSINTPVELRGYFQSWKYFQAHGEEIKNRIKRTSNMSQFAKNTIKEFEKMDATAVHIRRGDYLQLTDYHGLISKEYYRRTRDFLSSKFDCNRFVIFSDDINLAKEVWPGALLYVGKNEISSPLETLITMSTSKNFIGANSSFSWWSAYLNEGTGIKIFPRPWFATKIHDTNDLLLANWVTFGDEGN
jgi:hypothetical protein